MASTAGLFDRRLALAGALGVRASTPTPPRMGMEGNHVEPVDWMASRCGCRRPRCSMSPKSRSPGPRGPAPERQAVLYARVSSEEQEKEGYSIPAQLKLLRGHAASAGPDVVREFVDVETARKPGRAGFGEMLAFLKRSLACRTALVEKTDRLYRNLKDYVTLDELDLEIHFVKENVVLSRDSRSSERFKHGIRVLMARNCI